MEQNKNKTKVMVIGFDGASLNVLLPMIQKGKLPHFASIMASGVSGKLRSIIPPISGPAWTTFATGVYPGMHGVYDFFRNLQGNYACTPINSSFIPLKTLWEILSDQGKKVGVMNMLFSYPPQRVNGFVVSGRGTPNENVKYAYPERIKDEILDFEPHYRIEAYRQISMTGHFLKLLVDQLKCQERVNQYLFRKYSCDFTMSYFAVPDLIQHIFWKYMDPTHPNHDHQDAKRLLPLIEGCYQVLDDILSERLKMMDEDTILIVVSDHGAGPLHKMVQINKWLQDAKLLFLKEEYNKKGTLRSLLMLNKLLKGLISITSKVDILGLRRLIGFKTREKRMLYSKHKFIDWSRTKAYAGRLAECGIHVNLKGREGGGIVESGDEYEKIREFIISNLSELKDPQTGEKVFEKIWKREDLYRGPYVSHAPDLILDCGDRPYAANDSLWSNELLEKVPKSGVTGMHRNDGIIMALGKGIKKGAKIQGAGLSDLAPTILSLIGAEIPAYMEGKVLTDLMVSPSQAARKPSGKGWDRPQAPEEKEKVIYSEEESEDISKRLKDLGYL